MINRYELSCLYDKVLSMREDADDLESFANDWLAMDKEELFKFLDEHTHVEPETQDLYVHIPPNDSVLGEEYNAIIEHGEIVFDFSYSLAEELFIGVNDNQYLLDKQQEIKEYYEIGEQHER